MNIEVSDYIKEIIDKGNPSLKDVEAQVIAKFQSDLSASDISFILEQFKLILMKLWIEECKHNLTVKIENGLMNDDEVVKVLTVFRGLDAFEKTPSYLRGKIYKLVDMERKIFTTFDFNGPREQIINFLKYKVETFERNVKREFKFYEALIVVLRNSHTQLINLINGLKLQDFVNGHLTLYDLSQKIIKTNYSIDEYKALQNYSSNIGTKKSIILTLIQNDIRDFISNIKNENVKSGAKKIKKLKKKLMTSSDVNVEIDSDVHEIHIICDMLHIDADLPKQYRGKNVFIFASTIRLHKACLWDLSGYNGRLKHLSEASHNESGDGLNGGDGDPGKSGGNCAVIASEINNAHLWTLQSNGGNGSNGQSGGNGIDGKNGIDAKLSDFKILNTQITNTNYLLLLNQFGVSTDIGSRRKIYYENGKQRTLIFNRDASQVMLYMLIKGSSGTQGALGGFGGYCGQGGYAGKILCNISGVNIIANYGKDGINGLAGLNGLNGLDGSDIYMIIGSNINGPLYSGQNSKLKLDFSLTNTFQKNSIYYKPFNKYFYVTVTRNIVGSQPVRNTLDAHKQRLKNDEIKFYSAFLSVLKNSNQKFTEILQKLSIPDFVNRVISFSALIQKIQQNSFDIQDFDVLKGLAVIFIKRKFLIEQQLRDTISQFIAKVQTISKFNNIIQVKKKILTSAEIEKISNNFSEIQIICDTLHINSKLPDWFKGRNVAIYSNSIIVHQQVEWNLSGRDALPINPTTAGINVNGNGLDGVNGGAGESAGNITIECQFIKNASLLVIKANGGIGANGQNGGLGRRTVHGIDVNEQHFKINGREIYQNQLHQGFFKYEEELTKLLVVESQNAYFMIVKGSKGQLGRKGGSAGLGGLGGFAGNINIKSSNEADRNEIIIISNHGRNGTNGINGISDTSNCRDGRDAVLYVKNGKATYFGLNELYKYEVRVSCCPRDYSLYTANSYHYPRLTHLIKYNKTRLDDVTFHENLISVLKNSFDKLDSLVTNLSINDFITNNIHLRDVAFNVTRYDFDIPHYGALKEIATNYKTENVSTHGFIRRNISGYLEQFKHVDQGTSFEVIKKIIMSSELNNLNVESRVNEVRIICDTLHINSDLSSQYQGKNLAILANYVEIHQPATWNLSGISKCSVLTQSPAGINGEDGRDGCAGSSGGNFTLNCTYREFGASFTVISNGTNGTNGQDGGNGRNGKNGIDAHSSSFTVKNVSFRIGNLFFDIIGILHSNLFYEESKNSKVTTDDGLNAYIYVHFKGLEGWGLMLVKGSDGEKGTPGGIGGYGGQGGYGGNISILCKNRQFNDSIYSSGGVNGSSGKNGFNGKSGKDGRDLWKYDQKFWEHPVIHGEEKAVKYMLVWKNNNKAQCVWDDEKRLWVHVEESRAINSSSTSQRNQSINKKQKSSYAVSHKNSSINIDAIQNKQFLIDRRDEIQNIISQSDSELMTIKSRLTSSINKSSTKTAIFMEALKNQFKSYFDTNIKEISNKLLSYEGIKLRQPPQNLAAQRNFDIFTDLFMIEYSNYLQTSQDKLEQLTKKYQNIQFNVDIAAITVEINTKFQTEYDQRKDFLKKIRRFAIDRDESLYIELLDLLKSNECESNKIVELIKMSRFDSEKYNDVVGYLNTYKVNQSERKFKENSDIVLNAVETFLEDAGKTSSNNAIKKYYQLFQNGDNEWKKSAENPEILTALIKTSQNSQPSFLINLLKDSIPGCKLDVDDIKSLCKEKVLSLMFGKIYQKIIKSSESQSENHQKLSLKAENFRKQIWFLNKSKEFNSPSQELNKYFTSMQTGANDEVIKHFGQNIKNFQTSLPESIFHILINYSDDIPEISTTLKDFWLKFENIYVENDEESNNLVEPKDLEKPVKDTLEILEKSTQTTLEPNELFYHDVRHDKLIQLLGEFFNNDVIYNFIKNDIKSRGIKSLLFRTILAHKFGLKLVFCIKSFNGKFLVTDIHNYGDNLKAFYDEFIYEKWENLLNQDNDDSKDMNEIFILQENDSFSFLSYDKDKYENHRLKESIESMFDTTTSILKELHNQQFSMDLYSEEELKLIKFSKDIIKNMVIKENKFLNIFDNQGLWIDEDKLIDEIILSFPQNVLKHNDTEIEIHEVNEEKMENFKNKEQYFLENEDKIIENIKFDLNAISNLNGLSIIKAFAIRLHNDENSQNLEQFLVIVKSILNILSGSAAILITLTFMILGTHQENWFVEMILLKLGDHLGAIESNLKTKWKKKLFKLKATKTLSVVLDKIVTYDEYEEPLTVNEFDEIFENLLYFEEDNVQNLKISEIRSWKNMTTEKFWNKQLSELGQGDGSFNDTKVIFEDINSKFGTKTRSLLTALQNKKDDISQINLNEFLGNFNNGEWFLNDDTVKKLESTPVSQWKQSLDQQFGSGNSLRTIPQIVQLIKSDFETSDSIKANIDGIGSDVQQIAALKSSWNSKRIFDFTEDDVSGWLKSFNKPSVLESLAVISRVMQLKTKKHITLRDTSLISILTMWRSIDGVLMQISTGEGKTFIGVAFAILKVLYGQKIDIITSSSVLAERDATAEENIEIFSAFNLKVDHNCHNDSDRTKLAYDCDVVYGTLSNFQRDYLLTEFYDQNFISDHHFENILVDEVDSMLLDKGNNILYLSQDIPDLDEVESVFVFIWQWVNQNYNDVEEASQLLTTNLVRKVVIDTAYGIIDEDDVKKMGNAVNAVQILNQLKNSGIINEEGVILLESYDESKLSSALNGINANIAQKLKFYCRDKIESKKPIRIPKYLKDFVLLHLNHWIQSAVRALFLQNEKEYIIDRNNSEHEIETQPNIIILDLDTGTDMKNSQWDSGLHQFLQLKHGCKISLLSLKSVFISNVTFFKKYKKLYGMTGTLGNLEERKKTTKMHQIEYATVPRFLRRKFSEYSTICTKNIPDWEKTICDEVTAMFERNRSVLVICETVKDTKIIRKNLVQHVKSLSIENIIMYQRDTDEISIDKLKPGHAIIATNLAGRGLDIKLSDELENNGGLHVILSYLPLNARIENQAFGRSARAGQKGSGRLIISTSSDDSLAKLKETRNHNELQRLDEVHKYYENFVKIEEEFFEKFQSKYKSLKDKIKEHLEFYQDNFKLQWSFWLDRNAIYLDDWKKSNQKITVQQNFNKFLSKSEELIPIMRIELFKKIDEKDHNSANQVLMKNFQDDMVVFQYFKCYKMLKEKQIRNNNYITSMTDAEERELRKCVKMLDLSINDRIFKDQIINSIKDNYRESLVPIDAFEKQQKLINEVFEKFIENVKELIGADVNPNTFHLPLIEKDIMKNELFEELIKNDCIIPPQVSKYFTNDDVRNVAANHNIMFEDLKGFLEPLRGKPIKRMTDFEMDLKRTFNLPSREEFWNILIEKGLLTDEIEYSVVNMKTIRDVDPSVGELIELKPSLILSLPNATKLTLFFASFNEEQKHIIETKKLKSEISESRYKYLLENNVIEVNKKANFNIIEYTSSTNSKIFDKFDEIHVDDFKDICSNYKQIVQKLTDSNLKLLIPRTSNTYSVDFEELENFAFNDLGDDSVYQSKIIQLLTFKSTYRKALENIAKNIEEQPQINLHPTPYSQLINDLLSSFIIEQARADDNKINNCDKIFDNSNVSDILTKVGIVSNDSIINELKKMELISSNETINSFDINTANSSSKLKNIESTVKFLLQNRRILKENISKIKQVLKSCIKKLENHELEVLEVILEPVEKTLTDKKYNDSIKFMSLKGLGVFMKVQQKKYSLLYWWRFFTVIALAFLQLLVGVALVIFTGGLLYKVGEFLISEGISDAVFALSTLTTGHFTWAEYGEHKLISVLTYIVTGGISNILSKAKWTTKIFGSSLGKSLGKQTGISILKAHGKEGAKQLFKAFTKKVATSAAKALAIATIDTASDEIIKVLINQITGKIAEILVNEMVKNFPSHAITATIERMLKSIDTNHLKERIIGIFEKLSENHQFYSRINTIILDKVSQIAKSTHGIASVAKNVTIILTEIAQISHTSDFILTLFDNINNTLLEDLKTIRNADNVKKLQVNEIESFKSGILEFLKREVVNQFRNTLNSTVVKPVLNHTGHVLLSKANNSIKNTFKEIREVLNEKKVLKKVDEITARIKENEKLSPDYKLSKAESQEIIKVLSKTKNIKVYNELIKYDVPLNQIGIEGAIDVLKKQFGTEFKVEVEHLGLKHEFGSINNPNAKVIKLELEDGHFKNSKNSQFGNDCLYDALVDQHPELKAKMSPSVFRNEVASTIKTDSKYKTLIREYDNQYFMRIGFYGGQQNDRVDFQFNSDEKITGGSYDDISKKFPGRNNIFDVDHFLPDSIYRQTIFNIGYTNKPSVLLPHDFHKVLLTTGTSKEAVIYRSAIEDYLVNGKVVEAMKLCWSAYRIQFEQYSESQNYNPSEKRKNFQNLKKSVLQMINYSTNVKGEGSENLLNSAGEAQEIRNYVNNTQMDEILNKFPVLQEALKLREERLRKNEEKSKKRKETELQQETKQNKRRRKNK